MRRAPACYVTANWRLASVTIAGAGPTLTAGRPVVLFDCYVDTSLGTLGMTHCAAAPDGQRIVITVLPDLAPTPILVPRWTDRLTAR